MCLWSQLALPGRTTALSPPLPPAAPDGVTSDFDGDGLADLAIGVPGEAVGTKAAAGAVQVLYGSGSGLSSSGQQLWSQDTASIVGRAEPFDQFGFALGVGDFDADGYGDLAVGSIGEDTGETTFDSGAVNVIYGSPSGLSSTGNQFWSQASAGIADADEPQDHFGTSLNAGDFDGDGVSDLAIGARDEDIGTGESGEDAGSLHVLQGSPAGLSATGSQYWTQNSAGILDASEASDLFGVTLASGDIDGDGEDDLAVGVIGEDLGAFGQPGFIGDAGAVGVLYGSGGGLSATGNQLWTQNTAGVAGKSEGGDLFGADLVLGDFDGDGLADVGAGVFAEDVGTIRDAGSVNVLFGTGGGLSATGNQIFGQETPGVQDDPENGDDFGISLASGDFDGDSVEDLAIGIQGEQVGSVESAGALQILTGSAMGLSTDSAQFWTQNSGAVIGKAEPGDSFATSIAAANFGGAGPADLAVGSREGLGSAERAGAVNVLYGSVGGLTDAANQFWSQDSPGIPDDPEEADFFGIPVRAA